MMRAQIALEGLIIILLLLLGLSVVFTQINNKKNMLSEEEDLQYVKQMCQKIKIGMVHALIENNTVITLNFEEPFNITAYPDERGIFIEKGEEEYLCTLFTNKFSDSSVINDFNKSIITNLTMQNNNWVIIIS